MRGIDGPASLFTGLARAPGRLAKGLFIVIICTALASSTASRGTAVDGQPNPAGPTLSTDQATSTTTAAPTAGPIAPPGPTTALAGPTNPSTTATTPAGPPTPGSTISPSISTWTLAFGGDTLLTRRVSPTIDPFAGVRPPLADADLAIVNLETAISSRGRAEIKTFTFRSAPSFADVIARAGVDVVSLANNHSLDRKSVV